MAEDSGVGLRSIDDSREGIACFIDRNPTTSFVAEEKQLIGRVIEAMRREKITKLALVCFKTNESGNSFWRKLGWDKRDDLNYYTLSIQEDN